MLEFEHLANQHKDAVYRQLIRACGNREDAEDVLIEALLKAYQHMDQLRDKLAFRGWLAQIGKRVCWQLKERESLRPILQLSALEDNGEQIAANNMPVDSEIALKRMKQLLREAVASVPESARIVFELRDVEELSGEEVAARLGISLTAMKSRLHRARDQVRRYMDAALMDSRVQSS
jgi:RNA polymerase sigma-70 factor (ECF subfamily)